MSEYDNEHVFVLIKDYGCEGQKVHGVTRSQRIADIWALTEYGYYISAEVDGQVTNDPLPAVR